MAAIAAASASVAGHVGQDWALYAARRDAPLRLYLDPFPDRFSCEAAAETVREDGDRAQCRSRVAFFIDSRSHDQLAMEFLAPGNPYARFCGLRTQRQ